MTLPSPSLYRYTPGNIGRRATFSFSSIARVYLNCGTLMKMLLTRRTLLGSLGFAASSLRGLAASTKIRAGCLVTPEKFEDLLLSLREMKGLGYTGFTTNLRLLQTQTTRVDE